MNLNPSLPRWSRRAALLAAALLVAFETCGAQTTNSTAADAATLARWDRNKNGRLDPDELAAKLSRAYARELQEPRISVIVREFGAQIYIGGEVGRPRRSSTPRG